LEEKMLEKRREVRIPVENLPECLKNVVITTGFFQEHMAVTVDASNSGMGFFIEGMGDNVLYNGQNLTLKVLPFNYKLKSRVTYAKEVGDDKIRFGVCFNKEKDLDKYHELLELEIYK